MVHRKRRLPTLKESIAGYLVRRFELRYDPATELFVTVGGSEAIDMCIRALVEPGDEVLVVEPSFVCYAPIAALSHARVVPIATKAENGFRSRPKSSKRPFPPSPSAVLPFPSNPTGGIMTNKQLVDIAEVLRGTDIIVLSDEIYAEHDLFRRAARVAGVAPRHARAHDRGQRLFKAYAMTGWRLGYACGPEPIISQMLKIHQFAVMCAPPSAVAAIEAMEYCDDAFADMREEYNMRRRLLVTALTRWG